MDHLHAAVFEILHNLFVVNNRPEGVDRLFTALNFTVYRIDRPFDAEAEACTFATVTSICFSSPLFSAAFTCARGQGLRSFHNLIDRHFRAVNEYGVFCLY